MLRNLTFHKRPFIGHRTVGEHFILGNQLTGHKWIINLAGAEIWHLLDTHTTLATLVNQIALLNNCSTDDVVEPVENFLTMLQQCDLIDVFENNAKMTYFSHKNDMQADFHNLCLHEQVIESILLEVTYECNLRCRHCYVHDYQGNLTMDTFKRLFNELRELGNLDLTFSGGELFLRQDIFDIFQIALEQGFSISFITNGTLLTEEIVEKLKSIPIKIIKVSLYSLDPELHDTITGVRHSFEKTLTGINRLVEAGKTVTINTIIQKENAHEIPAIQAFAQELGCRFECDYKIYPRQNGDDTPLNYYISVDDLAHLFKSGIIAPPVDYVCGAGTHRAKINPEGNLYICEFIHAALGNIHQTPLKEIWLGSGRTQLREMLKSYNPPECTNCELKNRCGRCPGLVWDDGKIPNIHHELMCLATKAYFKATGEVNPCAD